MADIRRKRRLVAVYTSGTTGNPKGALYTTAPRCFTPTPAPCRIRSTALRATRSYGGADVHVNAWGLPYVACMVGAKLVFPGPGWTASRCTSCSKPKA